VITVALAAFGLLEPIENWSLTGLFELRGGRKPATSIVIVAIDEATFVELNTQWPFPREMHAHLLDKISGGRPVLIALDVILDTPSTSGSEGDVALGQAVASAGNVVLGAALNIQHVGPYTRCDLNMPLPVIKEYGAPLIISEFTYEHLKGEFLTKELGDVIVKGKTKPVKVYAVLGVAGAGPSPALVEREPVHAEH
jgi:CHASE2 domain-containing sensor protein